MTRRTDDKGEARDSKLPSLSYSAICTLVLFFSTSRTAESFVPRVQKNEAYPGVFSDNKRTNKWSVKWSKQSLRTGIRQIGDDGGTYKISRLYATSSKELRQREADEKEARAKRRRKTKTTKRKVVVASSATKTSKSETGKKKTKASAKATNKIESKITNNFATTPPAAATKTKLKTKSVLTKRLQQATARAKAAAKETEQAHQLQQTEDSFRSSNPTNQTSGSLGTLRQLTKIIDMELLSTATFNVHGTTNPPPGITQDSMRSLLEENRAQWKKSKRRQRQRNTVFGGINRSIGQSKVRHIAVVISKPLVQDQVTLEYACRLRALAKAVMEWNKEEEIDDIDVASGTDNLDDDDEEPSKFRPSIICFVGETTSGNLVSDADAGYIYFNHLCASNQISLEGIDIMVEKSTLGKGALKHVMRHLSQQYIPGWLKEDSLPLLTDDDDSDEEEEESEIQMKRRQQQSKKVQLHFSIFSCDYDVCRLNTIHYRSPQKSVLRPLMEAEDDEIVTVYPSLSASSSSSSRSGPSSMIQYGGVETSWSYRYTSYPYIQPQVKDSTTAFLGKCYLLAEELTPVLVNIRAVVDGTEFFQRDNYRALVSIRRSFVNDMERFYQNQPSLKSTLRQYVSRSDYPLDIVLEGALLSLGRCLDLVRPAGLLIGYVSNTDWKNAEMVLEHAVSQMRDACDPDHPLDPADWGKLDHHYDQPKDSDLVASSEDDLKSLTSWRLEDGEKFEAQEILVEEDDDDIAEMDQ